MKTNEKGAEWIWSSCKGSKDGNVHHFGPDWNISTTVRETAMKFGTDIHAAKEDESLLLWWSPDDLSSTTSRSKFSLIQRNIYYMDW